MKHICVNKLTSLVQIMACRLDGAKPLSEPMLEYCWLGPWEQTSPPSEILIEIRPFSFKRMHWKMSSEKWCPFCLRLNVLNNPNLNAGLILNIYLPSSDHFIGQSKTPSGIAKSGIFNNPHLTHWGRDKWPPFSRRHLQMHFLEWKCINFD